MSLSVTGRGHTIWEAAKQEWTKHICNLLVPVIDEGFRNIYVNCEKKIREDFANDQEGADDDDPAVGVITMFKNTLLNIPKWNQEIIDEEYGRLQRELAKDGSQDVLDDLVKAAFTSHILILSSVNMSAQPNKKVELNIPTSKRFVHKIYIEAARIFYRNPHLFAPHYNSAESEYRYHKNAARIEQVLCSSVSEAISKLMPIRTILRAYMALSGDGMDIGAMQEVEDITRRVSPRSRRGLRNILKSYIKTTSEVIDHPRDEDERSEDDERQQSGEKELKELPWPKPDEFGDNQSGQGEDDAADSDGDAGDEVVVEHVAGGAGRRDSLLTRRMSPQRSPRPTYRSATPPRKSRRHDDDEYYRSSSRRHRDRDSRRRRDRSPRRDRDRDRSRRRRRRYSGAYADDRRRRKRRDDDDDRRRRRSRRRDRDRDRDRDGDRDRDRRRDERKEGGGRDDRHQKRKRRNQEAEEDDYNFDLLTLAAPTAASSNGGGEQKKIEKEPSMNIEKRPSRPRSVEFRLEMSEEEEEGDQKKSNNKKRVTYKATDRDQAFFPELEEDNRRSHAPTRTLPPVDNEDDGRLHSA
jgi:hypothetical protein